MPELAKPARPWALRLLPPFPPVASRVLSLVGKEGVDSSQISDIIQMDPTFTAEILRVANSALFGLKGRVATVQHSVSLMGLDRVKTIATMIALHSMVKLALRVETLRKVWVHSLVTAVLMEECARACGLRGDGAYTVGMLHNLGSLGLMSAYPEEYNRMLEVSQECGFDMVQTERDLFEIDHCEAGAFLASEWNFPEEMVAAIAHHHDRPSKANSLAGLIRVAWRLADTAGFAAFPPDAAWSYDELLSWVPFQTQSWLTGGLDPMKKEAGARIAGW